MKLKTSTLIRILEKLNKALDKGIIISIKDETDIYDKNVDIQQNLGSILLNINSLSLFIKLFLETEEENEKIIV